MINDYTHELVAEMEMGGRQVSTCWEKRPTGKPENSTVIRLNEVTFDRPIPAKIFTLRNLRGR